MGDTEIQWEKLVEKWPSPFVARAKVGEFSGYLISPGTVANEDSKGTGPDGRFTANGRTMYHTEKLMVWLRKRAELPHKRKMNRKQ